MLSKTVLLGNGKMVFEIRLHECDLIASVEDGVLKSLALAPESKEKIDVLIDLKPSARNAMFHGMVNQLRANGIKTEENMSRARYLAANVMVMKSASI